MRALLGKSMLAAVQLDGEFGAVHRKIERIPTEWRLPPEVIPTPVEITQPPPQQAFGVGWPCAVSAGTLKIRSWNPCPHPPHPKNAPHFSTSPQGGGDDVACLNGAAA
ncbi:MAG: hypothetical protein WDM91_14105 [Rhizomicrobium sp.]